MYFIAAKTVLAIALISGLPLKAHKRADEFKVADLAFMAGSWEGKLQNGNIEETWLAPKAGSLLGMMREEVDGKTVIREFEVVEETPEGLMMTVKHFTPLMEEIPGRLLSRKLVSLKVGEAVFESTGPEPKQKLIYTKDGKDGLKAVVELLRNGKPVRLEIPMKRAK